MTSRAELASSRTDWIYPTVLALVFATALSVIYMSGPRNSIPPAPEPSASVPFDLNQPDRTYELPPRLEEISAVVVSDTEPIVWAVNDEEAKLYRIDLNDGSVEVSKKFGKPGDYEGIELVDGMVIVARSDGKLWRIDADGAQKISGPLDERYDVEGLGWDAKRSRLLVACKGKAGRGDDFEHTKAIYSVRVPSFEWSERPAFVVKRATLRRFLEEHPHVGRKPGAAKSFAPSAIGVDPATQSIYILSSTGKMLVVLDATGRDILDVVTLERSVHAQPEGLAFGRNGSLFISNEGRGTRPVLYRFDRRQVDVQPGSAGPRE
ncbi:MAG: SdiA-regulated domain-containing protein [Myxococcota bacterium]